jgi:hypothetical protein
MTLRLITELEAVHEVHEIMALVTRAKQNREHQKLDLAQDRKEALFERVVNTVAKAPIFVDKQELRSIALTAAKLTDPDLWNME